MLLSPDKCASRGTERKLVSVRFRHRRARPEGTHLVSSIRTGSWTRREPHSTGSRTCMGSRTPREARDWRLCMKTREARDLQLCMKGPGSTRPAALHKKPGSTRPAALYEKPGNTRPAALHEKPGSTRSAALHKKPGNHTYCSFAQDTAGAYSGQDPHASGSTGTPVS